MIELSREDIAAYEAERDKCLAEVKKYRDALLQIRDGANLAGSVLIAKEALND